MTPFVRTHPARGPGPRRALAAAVAVLAFAAVPGAARGEAPHGKIVYGGDRDFPPFEFLDSSGRPAGLNVELIRAIAKARGLEVEIRLEPWSQVRKDLADGRVDVAAMYRSEERAREVEFAMPHELVYHELFVRAGAAPLGGLADLAGKRVLFEEGSRPGDALAALPCRCTLVPTPSEPRALEALARGEGDVAVVSRTLRWPTFAQAALGRAIVQSGPPVLVAEYAFVAAKGRWALVQELDLGVAAVKASGEYERVYARWMRPDGSAGWLRWVGAGLFAALGGLALVGLWNRDLRRRVAAQTAALRRELEDRVRAEAALAEAERSLRAAQKLETLGRIAGGVAHDFNNILNVVSSYGAALRDDLAARGEATADVDEILSAGERATRLVKQLLAFRGARPRELAPIDLGATTAGMRSLLQRLVGSGIRVEVQVPPAPVVVEGETSFVEQILLNLAANARDAMGARGALSVRVATRPAAPPGAPGGPPAVPDVAPAVPDVAPAVPDLPSGTGMLDGACASLTVSDTGVGMDQATVARIYEPFFTTKPEGRGSGLGLSTVFAVVARMNGKVTVASTPGSGTTFEILLPLLTRSPPA